MGKVKRRIICEYDKVRSYLVTVGVEATPGDRTG